MEGKEAFSGKLNSEWNILFFKISCEEALLNIKKKGNRK